MKINEVEQQVGMTKKNIRFYEEQGLLSPRRNKENGYRDYDEADVRTLQQIKLLRKLGLPIEEIHSMQSGRSTVADSMRRHMVSLEREQRNLAASMTLCHALKEEEKLLCDLDAASRLAEMEALEQVGTTFIDKQKNDMRRISYVAPVGITALMTLVMVGLIALFIWAYQIEQGEIPLLLIMAIIVAIFCVIIGVMAAMCQRIGEIRKGEIDDAKKY